MITNDLSYKQEKSRLKIPKYVSYKGLSRGQKRLHTESKELLKNNSGELSFKGSISSNTVYKVSELVKLVDDSFGKYVLNSIKEITGKTNDRYFLFDKVTGDLTIKPRSASHFFRESVSYPIKQMPLDVLDFFASMLKKVGIEGMYDMPFLKNHRERVELQQKADSITGFFNTISKVLPEKREVKDLNETEVKLIKKFLNKQPQKIFDINTGHYDVAKERSLNRVVSGLIPAFFLANDAYNLSRLINDNKNEANEESKIRFRQEVIRVLSTAYCQLIMFGGFSKLVNNSKWASASLNVGIVLATETCSRLINHKPITFISKKHAIKLNEEEKRRKQNKSKLYGEAVQGSSDGQNGDSAGKTGEVTPIPLMDTVKTQKINEKKQKEFFSVDTLKKWVIGSVGIGLAATYLRRYPSVERAYRTFTGFFGKTYEKLTTYDAKLSKKDFDALMTRLQAEGLEEQANYYKNLYKDSLDKEFIKLGKQDKRTKQLVNLGVGPFKFFWETLALPFNLFKLAFSLVDPNTKFFFMKTRKRNKPFYPVEILSQNMKKMDEGKFREYLYKNLLASFNDISKSGVSNADLAKLVKVFSSTTTSWFLIADNYNMVMMKSNGENKDGAVQKGKERLVQRVSSIFYQTLLIDLFNNTFKSFYHSSLAGMSIITGSCTLCQEIINRKAIGMPILPHSKEEIQQIEEKHNAQKGFIGAYYRFMSKLIGKKQISQRNVQSEQK